MRSQRRAGDGEAERFRTRPSPPAHCLLSLERFSAREASEILSWKPRRSCENVATACLSCVFDDIAARMLCGGRAGGFGGGQGAYSTRSGALALSVGGQTHGVSRMRVVSARWCHTAAAASKMHNPARTTSRASVRELFVAALNYAFKGPGHRSPDARAPRSPVCSIQHCDRSTGGRKASCQRQPRRPRSTVWSRGAPNRCIAGKSCAPDLSGRSSPSSAFPNTAVQVIISAAPRRMAA